MERGVSARHPRALADIPEPVWQEACRREAVVRPLSTDGRRLSRQAVSDACAQLRLGKSQVYELLRRYRIDPRTTSLVPGCWRHAEGCEPACPGNRRHHRGLHRAVLSHASEADRRGAVPTPSEQECRKADLKPPSLNAVRRRVAPEAGSSTWCEPVRVRRWRRSDFALSPAASKTSLAA